jgi:hypothetical protein
MRLLTAFFAGLLLAAFAVSLHAVTPGTQLGTIGYYLATNQAKSVAYSVTSADCGTQIPVSSASTVPVTFPNTLPAGCNIELIQTGAGKITFTLASGYTALNPNSYTGTFNAAGAAITLQVLSNPGTTPTVAINGNGS